MMYIMYIMRFISSEFKSKTDICSLSKSPQTNKVQYCLGNENSHPGCHGRGQGGGGGGGDYVPGFTSRG